jgi:hypothetical protein
MPASVSLRDPQYAEQQAKFEAAPVAEVTGKEMGEIPSFKKFKEMKEFVLGWPAKQTGFYRNDYVNDDTGWNNIILAPSGVDSALTHGAGRQKIQVVPILPDLIKIGIHLDSHQNRDNAQIRDHIFAAKADIDGKPMVVGFVIKEEKGTGRRFYDHELAAIENLDGVEPTNRARTETPDTDPSRQDSVMNIVRKHLGVKPDFQIRKLASEKTA